MSGMSKEQFKVLVVLERKDHEDVVKKLRDEYDMNYSEWVRLHEAELLGYTDSFRYMMERNRVMRARKGGTNDRR
jgi:hypothetical protein